MTPVNMRNTMSAIFALHSLSCCHGAGLKVRALVGSQLLGTLYSPEQYICLMGAAFLLTSAVVTSGLPVRADFSEPAAAVTCSHSAALGQKIRAPRGELHENAVSDQYA